MYSIYFGFARGRAVLYFFRRYNLFAGLYGRFKNNPDLRYVRFPLFFDNGHIVVS